MNKKASRFKKLRLAFLFAVMVFFINLLSIALVLLVAFLCNRLGIIFVDTSSRVPLFWISLSSLIVGTILAFLVSRRPLAPLRDIMDAADKIADGDYTARVTPSGADDFRQLGEKFNHMAEEIGSVELLRMDFVSDFSHEFKTPIVSIRGFARALKWEDLSDADRAEYLDIIISESERLSALSENVLTLSKLEKQTILTGKKEYDLSEQIRLCIALLAHKWEAKHLDMVFDCTEYFVTGNEELLQEVWINLLDNAIKFTPEYGAITLQITKEEETLIVSISDQGQGIAPDALPHIFEKFYQSDPSHATAGSGLGLSIAKRIIELHGGTIAVTGSNDTGSTFQVRLSPSYTR